ncbi:uncharacterized protein LOC122386826 [Amphibalanus amphitrite]|uniref:uncharacterized protein LOC122386826 n=1 Tax=Amphibalanus amphitrite TaxID=1232801 RepID=UPI001C914A34|nr:uncharacterized protein LOC122386826 [Amphibalanus amphitrite]
MCFTYLFTDAPMQWRPLKSTLGGVNALTNGPISEWANSTMLQRQSGYDCLSLPSLTPASCSTNKRALCVKAADAGCPAGFLRSGSACVYASMAPATFSAARASCASLMSELYEPREPGLMLHVRSLVATINSGDHWIGLEEKYPGDFRFVSDHSSPLFSFFDESSGVGPINDGSSSGPCVKMATNGQLGSADCDDQKHFICLYKPRPLCPAGFVSFGETSDCFYHMVGSAERSGAQARCAALGAALGEIRETDTLNSFRTWHGNTASRLWTGVTDLAENNKFTTSDGLVPTLLPWGTGQGGDTSLGCTSLDRNVVADSTCESSAADGYLCVHSPAVGHCPSGFLELAGRCYRFSPTAATYTAATSECQKLSSSLATIDSAETALLLSSIELWDKPSFSWFVGLKLNADTGVWQNYDQSTPDSSVWDTQPTGQDCAVLAKSTGNRLLSPVACTASYKFICEWQPDMMNDAIPAMSPDGACFLDMPYPEDPDFRVSPGDYEPTKLTPDMCSARCQSLRFMYAGLKNGMFCFCSSVLRIERADASLCSEPCTGDPSLTCGGIDEYVQVYRTGGQAEIQGASIAVEQTTIQPVDTLFSFTASVEVGEQVLISYDLGDGSDATLPSEEATAITHQYSLPGEYTVTAIFTDVPGVAKPRYDQTTVTVGEEVGQVEFDCPDLTEPGDEISCQLWLVTGAHLKLTLEMDKGFVDGKEYTIPDPVVSALGLPPPQHPTEELQSALPSFRLGQHGTTTTGTTHSRRRREIRYGNPVDSSAHSSAQDVGVAVNALSSGAAVGGVQGDTYEATTVVMPWAKVTDAVVLVGFEYYATKAGNLKLMVFRPTCPGGSYCHSTGTCDDGLCNDIEHSAVSCPDSNPLYAPMRQCQQSLCTAGPTASPTVSSDGNSTSLPAGRPGYSAVYSVTEQVAAVGYGKLLVDTSLETATWLQPGDVIGYESDGAVIGWRPARPGQEQDAPELAALGPQWLDDDSSGSLDSRHYLRAIVSSPLQLTINHTYDVVGAYQAFATVSTTGDIVSETSAGQAIDVQVPITGFKVTLDPEHVTTNNKTNATVLIKTGSFVKITFDFGETHLGAANVIEEADTIENDGWSQIYWYKRGDPGPRYVIITAENKWGRETYRHTLYVQRAVTDKWYLVDNAPVLWPIPGDVNFTVVYPAGLPLPTMASAELYTGDGYVFEWEIPEEREAGEIYEIGFNRSYDIQGSYRAKLRIFNLASEFEMTNRVPVWAEIQNLTTMAYYLPFLPIGGDTYLTGHGPEYDSFPIERNVSFFLNMTQGMIFQYILEMDNGTFLTNSSTSPVNYIFPEPGTYSVSLYGWNPLQGRSIPVNITVKVLESPVNVIIDDYLLVSEAKSAKEFEIRMDSVGTYTCLMWTPGDGSKIQGWGDRDTCDSVNPPIPYIYQGAVIENPLKMTWTYMKKGQYKMSVHAFNFLAESRYELGFTVSSIPCRPPDLMIRDSSTAFWMPKPYFRKDSFELFTVCSIDCNASLDTTKTWTAQAIDESWGNITGSVDLTSLSSYMKSTLFVPSRFMEYGTYKMTYSLQISGEGMDPTQPFVKRVFTYVRINRSPLLVTMLSGGSSAIQRGYNQMVVLEPERFSKDPDYPDDTNLVYSWFCRRLPDEKLPRTKAGWLKHTEPLQNPIMNATVELYDWVYDNVTNATYEVERPDLGGCFGQGPGMLNITGGRLELNTLQFRTNNATYEISVQMRKADPTDPRLATGTTLVEVVAGSPPIVSVMCQVADMCRVTESGSIINPSSRVALVGTCQELCDGRLTWAWRVFYVRNFTEYRIQDGDKYIIGAGKPSVAVKKDLYSDYPDIVEFRVKVSVTRLNDGETGVATMYLLLNQAPMGGTCTVTPPEGRVVNLRAHGVVAAEDSAQAANGTSAGQL